MKEKKTAKLKAAKGPPAATDSPSLPPPPPQADAAAVAGGERQQTLRLIRVSNGARAGWLLLAPPYTASRRLCVCIHCFRRLSAIVSTAFP